MLEHLSQTRYGTYLSSQKQDYHCTASQNFQATKTLKEPFFEFGKNPNFYFDSFLYYDPPIKIKSENEKIQDFAAANDARNFFYTSIPGAELWTQEDSAPRH